MDGLSHANLVKGITAVMHYRSDQDSLAKEWATLLVDVDAVATLAKVAILDEENEVVAQVVNAYNVMQ